MSDGCDVCFDWSDCNDDPWFEFEQFHAHVCDEEVKCYECRDTIPINQSHERIVAIAQEGEDPEFIDTCNACQDIRDALNCSSTIIAGLLWEELEHLYPELTTACIGKVRSKAGRAKLLSAWLEWKGLAARPAAEAREETEPLHFM